MTNITFKTTDGETFDVAAQDGASVMEAAVRNGVPGIPADCGGACACATCHVYVPAEWLDKVTPVSDMEQDMLELAERRQDNSRLSCQIRVSPELEGATFTIPLA